MKKVLSLSMKKGCLWGVTKNPVFIGNQVQDLRHILTSLRKYGFNGGIVFNNMYFNHLCAFNSEENLILEIILFFSHRENSLMWISSLSSMILDQRACKFLLVYTAVLWHIAAFPMEVGEHLWKIFTWDWVEQRIHIYTTYNSLGVYAKHCSNFYSNVQKCKFCLCETICILVCV